MAKAENNGQRKGKGEEGGGGRGRDQMHTIEADDIGTYLGGSGRVARQHLRWIREGRRNSIGLIIKGKKKNAVALSKSLNAIRTRTHTHSLSFYVGIVKEGKGNSSKSQLKKERKRKSVKKNALSPVRSRPFG